MCFWAWRVQKMTGSLGYRIGFFYSLNLVFANLPVAAITPSQAGGEPVRIHELYRANVPLGDATAIVIMERVLDGVVLAILAAFAMIVLADQWKSLGAISEVMAYITWIFVVGCLFLFYLAIKRPDIVKNIVNRCARFFTSAWESTRVEALVLRVDKEIDNFNDTVIKFVKSAKGGLLWGIVVYPALLDLIDCNRFPYPPRAWAATAHLIVFCDSAHPCNPDDASHDTGKLRYS
jgi:hypothetical protein